MQILNTAAAMEMVDNDISLYKILLESYISDKVLEQTKLEELESLEDTTEAAKYVHYFKGAARQLGAELLAQAGQNLEDVLRKKTEGNVSELNRTFVIAYNEAVEEMKSELKNISEQYGDFLKKF